VVRELAREMGIDIPIFGMVKDDFHKTRALCTDQEEISIAKETAVFQFIYGIQEEVHRYTVGSMKKAKGKTLVTSSLTKIPGIGPAKAAALLKMPGGLQAVKRADKAQLMAIKGIGEKDADAIIAYFKEKR
jgi:excinuclease ABC subunit C